MRKTVPVLAALCLLAAAFFVFVLLQNEGGLSGSGGNGDALSAQMPAFSTLDLDGNQVDSNMFGQADLTVINVWGTFCGPCISELPELGAWARELPENVQLIGLLCDVSLGEQEGIRTAQKLVADYTNLLLSEDLEKAIAGVRAVPTTFFVDRDGKLVGDPVIGANPGKYRSRVEAFLAG